MSAPVPATAAAADRAALAALLLDVTRAFGLSDATRVKRGAAVHAAAAAGATDQAIATAATKSGDSTSRGTVGFYRRTYALYSAAATDSPALFTTLWGVVTRGKGITDEDVAAVLVAGDARATGKAIAALVAERKALAETAAAAERVENKRNEAAAEAGAMAAPAVAAPDFGLMVATLVGKATTPEARRRLAAALAQGIETLNRAERDARAARKAPVAA